MANKTKSGLRFVRHDAAFASLRNACLPNARIEQSPSH